tara:strand:- start:3542 stop:4240 length:699 start_codon:yes stop_codon:yes gene_type:complete
MKALLLAAGLGTRLRPITNNTPKCLVKIQGTPLLQLWIEKLQDLRVSEIIINTHYLSKKVENFINTLDHEVKITLSHENELLGTAGTLLKHVEFFQNEDLLLIHADNFCNDDLNNFINVHKTKPNNCQFSMLTFRTNKPEESGILEIDKENILISFEEKPDKPKSNLANGAVYCLSPFFLKKIVKLRDSGITDFSTEILPEYIGKIITYETKEIFMDIGSLESYELINETQL